MYNYIKIPKNQNRGEHHEKFWNGMLLVLSTVCSVLIVYYKFNSFYIKFISGNAYYWLNSIYPNCWVPYNP